MVSCTFCPDNGEKQNSIPKKKAIKPLWIENVVLFFIRYVFDSTSMICASKSKALSFLLPVC